MFGVSSGAPSVPNLLSLYKMGLRNLGMVWCTIVHRGANLSKGVSSRRGIQNTFPNYEKAFSRR